MAPKPRTFNLYGEYAMTYYDISILLDKSTAAVRQAINDQYGGSAQEYLASLGLRDAESIKALMERNEARARQKAEREQARAERIRNERAQELTQDAQKERDAVDTITGILLGAENREENIREREENVCEREEKCEIANNMGENDALPTPPTVEEFAERMVKLSNASAISADEILGMEKADPQQKDLYRARDALFKLNELIRLMGDKDIEDMMNGHGVLDVYAIRAALKDMRFAEFGEYINWTYVAEKL